MVKYLLLGVVVYIAYLVFFRKKRENVENDNSSILKKDSETMVECVKCSTFISPKEALIKNGKFYCSNECLEAK